MFGMSMWEILVVLGLLFVVVGPAKLPGLAKKLGDQLRSLRQGLSDVKATVDKDDEFVKAVSEARQSVVEAKAAVQGIFDDVVNVTEDLKLGDEFRDPAPKPVSRGRRMVSRPNRVADGGAPDGAAAQTEVSEPDGDGPALVDEPVEAEDWRASALSDAAEDAAGDAAGEDDAEERPAGRMDDGGVPRKVQRRGATGRKMIRPGRSRGED